MDRSGEIHAPAPVRPGISARCKKLAGRARHSAATIAAEGTSLHSSTQTQSRAEVDGNERAGACALDILAGPTRLCSSQARPNTTTARESTYAQLRVCAFHQNSAPLALGRHETSYD